MHIHLNILSVNEYNLSKIVEPKFTVSSPSMVSKLTLKITFVNSLHPKRKWSESSVQSSPSMSTERHSRMAKQHNRILFQHTP